MTVTTAAITTHFLGASPDLRPHTRRFRAERIRRELHVRLSRHRAHIPSFRRLTSRLILQRLDGFIPASCATMPFCSAQECSVHPHRQTNRSWLQPQRSTVRPMPLRDWMAQRDSSGVHAQLFSMRVLLLSFEQSSPASPVLFVLQNGLLCPQTHACACPLPNLPKLKSCVPCCRVARLEDTPVILFRWTALLGSVQL